VPFQAVVVRLGEIPVRHRSSTAWLNPALAAQLTIGGMLVPAWRVTRKLPRLDSNQQPSG
jgi:hypothetical protein